VPSLALGSSEVTLLELVRAYGVLAFEVPDGITEGYVTLIPYWEGHRGWGGEFKRRAARLLQELIAEELVERRSKR